MWARFWARSGPSARATCWGPERAYCYLGCMPRCDPAACDSGVSLGDRFRAHQFCTPLMRPKTQPNFWAAQLGPWRSAAVSILGPKTARFAGQRVGLQSRPQVQVGHLEGLRRVGPRGAWKGPDKTHFRLQKGQLGGCFQNSCSRFAKRGVYPPNGKIAEFRCPNAVAHA